MGKDKDPVWEEWQDCGLNADGKRYAKCKHCDHRLQLNVTRFKQHLVQLCPEAPDHVVAKYQDIVCSQSIATARQKRKMQLTTPSTPACSSSKRQQMVVVAPSMPTQDDPTATSASASNPADNVELSETETTDTPTPGVSTSTAATGKQRPIYEISESASTSTSAHKSNTKAFEAFFDRISSKDQEELAMLWAVACYTNGWSFNAMNNPFLKDFFAKIRPGWKMPTAYTLSTSLLDSTERKVDALISEAMKNATNLTLQLDGWSDVNRVSLINVAMYAGKPIFLKSVEPGLQRHDAEYISSTIIDIVNSQTDDNKRKVRSVVTDQPSVMKAAWKIVNEKIPSINCYGCGAHVINLLACDFRKIPSITDIIEKNRKIANFYKSHSMAKEVLSEVTKEKYKKDIHTILGCQTRWSTEYFMLRRNIRIRSALVSTVVDQRLSKELRASGPNIGVKITVLDDNFWLSTMRIACLMKPLSTAIQHCEGDNVSVSVMPRIWRHISSQINRELLGEIGFDNDDVETIIQAVDFRRTMNTYPVTLAAHALDARFHGNSELDLSEEEWQIASNFIINLAEQENLQRINVLNDLAEYRSKTGLVFGDLLIWEAINTSTCSRHPDRWWQSFVSNRQLSLIARILLSMPATAAMVERCNKAYSVQKTKSRNRLLPGRAGKLAKVSYNLQIQRRITEPTKRDAKRKERNHIMSLSVALPHLSRRSETETVGTSSLAQESQASSAAVEGSQYKQKSAVINEDDTTGTMQSLLDDHYDSDAVGESDADDGNDDSSSGDEDTELEDEEPDSDDDLSLANICLMSGDWVAVKVYQMQSSVSKNKSRISTGTTCKNPAKAMMHIARVEEIEEHDGLYSVSFLKRQADGSYVWPIIEDRSSVDRSDIVFIAKPLEDIASTARVVRVKLIFNQNDLESARKHLNISPGNIR